MSPSRFLLLASITLSSAAQAQVYRCDTDTGTHFSDRPCGDNAKTITIQDNRIGGNFGDNLPPESETTEEKKGERRPPASKDESACRFINSTDLRTYLTRNQVVKGMTKDHVLRAFGRPPETYPTPQETWVYHTRYYGALYELTYVYFKDGCVERVDYRKP